MDYRIMPEVKERLCSRAEKTAPVCVAKNFKSTMSTVEPRILQLYK